MAWLRRTVAVEVAAAPTAVARRLDGTVRGDRGVTLVGYAGPAGFELSSEWRPAFLRQHYPVAVSGTLTPIDAGTRVEATVSAGFAVQFMLAGVGVVTGLALWAGVRGAWSPLTSSLVLIVALGHLYSVYANLRDAERTLRRTLLDAASPPAANTA